MGPDIDLAPTAVSVTKTATGVLMMWVFGPRSFSLELECGTSGIPGLATEGGQCTSKTYALALDWSSLSLTDCLVITDMPYVIWRQDGICDAGPGEPIPPVEEPEPSKWGRNFLIILGVGIFL